MKLQTFVLVAMLLALPIGAPLAAAQPLGHQGQLISDHVVLVGSTSDKTPTFYCEWTQLFPNGEMGGQPFTIPKGRALVVTDVEWDAFLQSHLQHSHDFGVLDVKIWLNKGFFGPPVFRSSSVAVGAPGKVPWLGTNDQLSTGFVVMPGTPICGHATVSTLEGSAFVPALNAAVLRGYLIDFPKRRLVETRPGSGGT